MSVSLTEEAYSEYVMGGYTICSFAEHRGITIEEASELIAMGRRVHISNTKDVRSNHVDFAPPTVPK